MKKTPRLAIAIGLTAAIFMSCDDTKPDAVLWAKKYLAANSSQSSMSVVQTADKGYITAGIIERYGSGDMGDVWVAALNSDGSMKWEKFIGGPNLEQGIEGMSVMQTSDGGFAVLSRTRSFGVRDENGLPAWNAWVIRLGASGQILWQKAYGIEPCGSQASSMIQTGDGGFLISGGPVIKIDQAGNVLWSLDISASHAAQGADGSLMLAWTDYAGSIGLFDVSVARIGADGRLIWKKSYGQASGFADARDITASGDGGFVVTGSFGAWSSSKQRAENDIWAMKINSNGDVSWSRSINLGGYIETATSIASAQDGLLIAGSTNSFDESDAAALKIDQKGNILFQKTFDADVSGFHSAAATDYGFVMSGYSGSSSLLVCIDKNGALPSSSLTVKNTSASSANQSITVRPDAGFKAVAVIPTVTVTDAESGNISSNITSY
ncbi:MAG: hypothetical protein MUD12_16100 [Spirochaetes bacterium]|nr:hypothetical protein [Spirochaetota bacterium]